MTGQAQFVQDMKRELVELHRLCVLNKTQLARAVAYVEKNAAEYGDPNMYNDVTSAVDCVLDIVRSDCNSGRC